MCIHPIGCLKHHKIFPLAKYIDKKRYTIKFRRKLKFYILNAACILRDIHSISDNEKVFSVFVLLYELYYI